MNTAGLQKTETNIQSVPTVPTSVRAFSNHIYDIIRQSKGKKRDNGRNNKVGDRLEHAPPFIQCKVK